MKIFDTERLEICELTKKDWNFFVELLSAPKIIDPIPQPRWTELEIANKFETLTNYSTHPNEKEKTAWGVYEKGKDELIGLCAYLTNDEGQREIGYRFRKKYWGKGYGTEVTKHVIDYCFNTLNVQLITADVNTENLPSVKILEKFLRPVKEFYNNEDGTTDRRYELTKEEFLKKATLTP